MMEFVQKVFFVLLALLIWSVSAAALTWPFKWAFNHSLAGYWQNIGCRESFGTLMLIGFTVILFRRPTPPSKPRD